MKAFLATLSLALLANLSLNAALPEIDYSHIDIYVTPYYFSEGPTVQVGRFSSGLASKNEAEVVATIVDMKEEWERLTFPQLYVAAIRLYDFGYRSESVYWFYSAQYRGRQFSVLLDQERAGSIGELGFELHHAQQAFHQLAGKFITAFAFRDLKAFEMVIKRVQAEGRKIPDLQAVYPGVVFIEKTRWEFVNTDLADRMDALLDILRTGAEDIKRQRIELGLEEKISKLTDKEFPGN